VGSTVFSAVKHWFGVVVMSVILVGLAFSMADYFFQRLSSRRLQAEQGGKLYASEYASTPPVALHITDVSDGYLREGGGLLMRLPASRADIVH
jgi:hypothetical protein